MVKTREEQLGPITILDENGDGYVDASDANIHNVSGISHTARSISPGNDSIWFDSSELNIPKYTDSNGVDHILVEGLGSGTFYVDADAGSDTNDGTQASPLATLDKALKIIGSVIKEDTTIYLNATSDANGYSTEELWKPRLYRATLYIAGNEVTELHPSTAIDSYSSQAVYDFSSASPGWTDDQFRGKALEFVDGPSNIPVGQKRTILTNTSDVIIASNRHVDPSFTDPQAGDKFRVVEPSVIIDATEREIGSSFGSSRKLYGGQEVGTGQVFQLPRNMLKIENIEFRIRSGQSKQAIQIAGVCELNGCVFSKDSSNLLTLDVQGMLFSGEYHDADDSDDPEGNVTSMGYCSVGIDRSGGSNPLPHIDLINSTMYGGFVGGGLAAKNTSRVFFSGNGSVFDNTGRSGWPHGTVYCGIGSTVIFSGSGNNIYITGPEYDMEAEYAGIIEVYNKTIHLGSNAYARARHKGFIKIQQNPILATGASGMEVVALYGGEIRLLTDGSTLGDVRVGQTFPNRRSAGAWEVNEVLTGSEFTSIYRTT